MPMPSSPSDDVLDVLESPGKTLSVEHDQHRVEPRLTREQPPVGQPPQSRRPHPPGLARAYGLDSRTELVDCPGP